ncbi:MAG: glycoside-pentoside-hexuronide (GPH):cation symporter [Candidatus Nanopelagicales bacterium]
MAVTSPAAAPPATPTPKKLGWRQYSGYATGDAANNLAFAMASSFLLLYYTNVVGIGAAAIGTMFLLIRFWDALADLFAGRLVDAKKPGRYGKFRPFIMWFSLPLLLSSMAIFSAKTFFPNLNESQALIYAYISYAVMGTLYSLVNIPYGSIAPAMTQVPTERAKLANWRVWGSNITILMLSFVVAPQIKKFAGDAVVLQRSLFMSTAIFVVVGMALYLWTVMNVKEQVVRDVAAPTLRESFGTLTHNKPLIWLCLGSLAFLTGLTALGTLAAYYAMYVLKDPSYIAWNSLAQVGGTFLISAFIPKIVRGFGKRNGYIVLGIVGVIAGILLAFLSPSVPLLSLIGFFLLGIGMGGVNTLMWALEADTVEYGEWKTGIRTEGTTYALFSFTRKMGQALGRAAGAFALGYVGFSSVIAKEAATRPREPSMESRWPPAC